MIIQDPFYRKFQQINPDVDLEEYGYMGDDDVENYNWATNIPIDHLARPHRASSRIAVAVFTGAFDPFHAGHAESVLKAVRAIEGEGYTVAFTHIVPTSATYVAQKHENASSCSERVESIERFGFTVDKACMIHDKSPDYTSVLLYVRDLWLKAGVDVTVFNIVGSDNQMFAPVVENYDPEHFGTVVVVRDGDTLKVSGRNILHVGVERRKFSGVSSTRIRSVLKNGNAQEKQETKKKHSLGTPDSRKPVMFIKDDTSLYTSNPDMWNGVKEALVELYNSYGFEVRLSHYESDIYPFITCVREKYGDNVRILSLDALIPCDDLMNVHRVFGNKEGRNGRNKKLGYMEDSQPEIINGQKYVIVDDDTSTGGTYQYAKKYVENNGGVVVGAEFLYSHDGEYDVVDVSDFTTLPDSGLYITYTGHLEDAEPRSYFLDHVNLHQFASVPLNEMETFNNRILGELDKVFVGWS